MGRLNQKMPSKPSKQSLNIGISEKERAEIEEIILDINDPKYTLTSFIREAVIEKIDRVRQLQCPKCRKLNDRFARYCDQCGEPLSDEKQKIRKELDALVKEHPEILLKVLEDLKE
jgi:hypothetical protein